MKIAIIALATLALGLSACQDETSDDLEVVDTYTQTQVDENGCAGEAGTGAAIASLQSGVLKQVKEETQYGDRPSLPDAVLRTSIESIEMSIKDVRTTDENFNNTKKTCTGILLMAIPADLIERANPSLSIINETSVEEMALEYNIEQAQGYYQIAMDYNVQPTDDGTSVYAQALDADMIVGFLSQLVEGDVYSGAIRREQAAQEKAEAAEMKEQSDALADRNKASVLEATEIRKLSNERINGAWANLPEETRTKLTPVQRAWNLKKEATCRLEASDATSNTQEALAMRYKCEAKMNFARATEFDGLAQDSSDPMGSN